MTYKNFNDESTRSSVLRVVANTKNETAWQRLVRDMLLYAVSRIATEISEGI